MENTDHIYWMFSSAAQTVAAFVAFLLAGYALVVNMMDKAVEADETLADINEALKQRYHAQLGRLVIITAGAIISCLGVVYLNRHPSWSLPFVQLMAASLTMLSIVTGVIFVINIVDPKKYRSAAQQMEAKVREATVTMEVRPPTSDAEFFQAFVDIERLIRDLWHQHGERLSLVNRPRPAGVREMARDLMKLGVLSDELFDPLMEVNRYRNLVFHGHVKEVDPKMMDEANRLRGVLRLMRARPTDT